MLLVFATRYDEVTERTFQIARRLLEHPAIENVLRVELLESEASAARLSAEIGESITVLAFYTHGDVYGRILAQDERPCWDANSAPSLANAAIVAHACRAMVWLESLAGILRARAIFAYRVDLITPPYGSDRFWNHYNEIHSLLAALLASGMDPVESNLRFYDACTSAFQDLHHCNASLIELIAVLQSRDKMERLP